ncbi:MAG: hypothetical protein H6712_34710 [Myxococcales bacterium]|nr:hypothetical protein [Myxococcales bacterium]MCB9719049.1 hypothetical protein [Myxococcales bacterium]
MAITWGLALALGSGLGLGCGDDGQARETNDTTTPTSGGTEGSATDSGATDPSADGTATDTAETSDTSQAQRPNWHEDIAPFVAQSCRGCHTAGSVAPFPMDDYEQTWPLAAAMLLQIDAAAMPPWHAIETDECSPPNGFKHDPRLTPEQIEMMHAWVDLGMPEGDPANAVPVPEPPSTDLADPTATDFMQGSIDVQPEGPVLDFFHCLSLDPGNGEEVFVDGMQVIPGNDAIAHHVLVYIDIDGASAAWPDGQRLDCGGGTGGISNVRLVGAWVPGSLPMEPPEGVGIRLPAGARILLNMHYHAAVTGPETDGGTGIALRWTTTPPQYVSDFRLIGVPGVDGSLTTAPFFIPAGATDHVEEVEFSVPTVGGADVRIWSILNHMHKVGVDMKVSVMRGGEELCLVQTPAYDYNWQRIYEYDADVGDTFRVQAGDVVRVRCTYDNTLDNPSVVEALQEVGLDQPQDVQLGEGTLDEMCITGVGVAIGP